MLSAFQRKLVAPSHIGHWLFTGLCCLYIYVSPAQISLLADQPYTQEFNALASGGGTGSALPANWVFLETGGGANSFYTIDNGNLSTNDTYSYGSTSSSERALGQVNGTTVSNSFGASFINNSGTTITSLLIQYAGEQWRLGATGRSDRIDFQYSTDATSINNGTWTDMDVLDFNAPVTTGGIGALDGNLSVNRKILATTMTGLSISNGSVFWIRWNSFDATGNDDGLSIDDFAMTANPAMHYTVSSNGLTLSITDTDGNGEELDMTQSGSNIRFYAAGRTYSLNGGATTPLPVDIAIAGLSNVVINAGTGSDTIDVEVFNSAMPSLTINGGINDDVVNLNGDINFAPGSFFNADLQNDNATPGTDKLIFAANANIICSGTGIATIKVSSNILFNSGSSIVTANGNLVVEANQQFTPTSGNFAGIDVNNALIQTTGMGTTTIKGTGGNTGTLNNGIQISSGGDIIGGTSGALTIQGFGGGSTGTGNRGVSISGSGSTITSSGANVSVTGTGGGSSTAFANYGVHVISSAMITAGGTGTVTISGTGGVATGGNNIGLWIGTNGIITSNGGNVSVTGNGGGANGAGSLNYGVYVQGAGKITAGGTGTVTVIGTGGAAKGASNDGVSIWETNSIITSSGGDVNVTGYGGGDPASVSNVGVHLQSSGKISAGSTGNVTVTGTGSLATGNSNFGIFVIDNGSSITSFEGNVTLNGVGGGSGSSGNNYGIVVFNGLVASGETGTLSLTGTGGSATGNNNIGIRVSESFGTITTGGGNIIIIGIEGGGSDAYAIQVHNSATITTETNGGDITLIGNSMSINSGISTDLIYGVQLYPYSNDVDINLGPAAEFVGGPLQFSDIELDYLTTGVIFIGSINSGSITLSSNITRSALTHMVLICDENVTLDGGSLTTAGGDLFIAPGESPDAIKPPQFGIDISCGTFFTVGEVAVEINGTVADTTYTQLNIEGEINLAGLATLNITGTHDPQPGEEFIIVNNDGTDAITGTFFGLAEGAVLTSFLGGDYPATISYVGGTGNDVVITVASPNYILTTTANQITLTDIAGNGETITVSQDGVNNIMFSVPGRNYSWNGGAVTALPVSTSLLNINSITVNAGAGNDGITVNAFTVNMCNLTLNGGAGNDHVIMNGDIIFTANANLDIDLQNDVPVPGEDKIWIGDNANLSLTGNGSVTLKVSQGISHGVSSSLTTVDGNLTMEANQQAIPTAGPFYGVVLPTNSLVEITGTGVLSVKGKGGTSGHNQIGVYLFNSAVLKGGTMGDHIIRGTGGLTSTGDHNRGVQVQLNSIITTNGGHLVVYGDGGGAEASNHNHGVHLVQGGVISAGDFGTVTIWATGGSSTGIRNHGIHVYNAGSMVTSNGANVYVNGFSGGTGASSFNHGVFVEDNAIITAGGSGIVNVQGYGGSAEGERNDGVICFRPGAMITSGGGDVNVTGQGGGSGASFSNYGVFVENGAVIMPGGMGDAYVNGTGGAASGDLNAGVYVYQANSMITSSGGDVHVTGQGGGTGSGSYNFGVYVLSSATITAGNLGNVYVEGIAGITAGTRNDGVCVESATATITSSGGHVEVIGQGGGTSVGFRNYGVYVNDSGIISALGLGNVNVEGTGGMAEGVRNYGVLVEDAGSLITSSGGTITVVGQGGGTGTESNNNFGTYLNSGSIIAPGNATINIEGTGGDASGPYNYGVYSSGISSSISTVNGDISITGNGGGIEASSNNIGVRIDAIVSAGGSGDVIIEANGGPATGNSNYGFATEGADADISTSGGNITVTGQGGGSGSSTNNYGTYMNGGGQLIAGDIGTVTIEGNGGNTAGGSNIGVYVSGTGTLISSNGGNVNVTGAGGGALGNGSNNFGIDVLAAGMISAGGMGDVTLNGTGGASTGSNNYGVYVFNSAATVSSSGGDIHIIGQGGGAGAGGSNIGFHLQSQGKVEANGMGEIFIEGNGGPAQGGGNHGALILHLGTSITTDNGDIEIIGNGNGIVNAGTSYGLEVNNSLIHAGGDGNIILEGSGAMTTGNLNHGVTILGAGGEVTTAAGNIFITGVPGLNANALGIQHSTGAEIHTLTGGGNISLVANSMNIQSTISTSTTDTVFISSLTIDTSILLGITTNGNTGPLKLSDAELDVITTGTLMIGANTAGTITVADTITREVQTIVNLTSHGDVIFNGGHLNTNGGNSKLDPGSTPAAVRPLKDSIDIFCDTLTFGSDLAIRINGNIPDATYDRLYVNGVIELTGVALILSGTYTPMQGDSFVIVMNDGMDAVIDTFAGLSEGDTLFNFLGDTLDAVITYLGNTGNDVVIRIPIICFMPDIPVLETGADTICQQSSIELSILSGNLGSATDWYWYSDACGGDSVGIGTSVVITPSETATYYVRGEGGCVTSSECAMVEIVVNPLPTAGIDITFSSPCYFTEHIFQPEDPIIPGATYIWDFGEDAVPPNAVGYGPHSVQYTSGGEKAASLEVYTNEPGAQCGAGALVIFDIETCPGQVTGKVLATNGNPIVNVNVKLYVDADANGIPDSAGAIRNVFTGPNGIFTMASLVPTHYLIIETQPNGWITMDDGDLTPDGDVLANTDSLDNLIPLTITASKIDSNNVFLEAPNPGSITGVVFDDLNVNEVPDPGEGITDVTVRIFPDNNLDGIADNNIAVATTTTIANGSYTFLNIPVGNYVLVETTPTGLISIKDFDATNDNDAVPNTNTNNDTIPVTLLTNESDAQNFFIDGSTCSLVVTNTNDSGYGSFRHAVECAQSGDTIHFHTSLTGESIIINSDIIQFDQQVVMISNLMPRVTITSAIDGLFQILGDGDVEFKNLDLVSGVGMPGAGAVFENHGELKLFDVEIYKNPGFDPTAYLVRTFPGANTSFVGLVQIKN